MTFSREITAGNVLSWILVIVTAVSAYSKMEANSVVTAQIAAEAKLKAESAQTQNATLHADIRVLRVQIDNLESKIDDIRNRLPRNQSLVQNIK